MATDNDQLQMHFNNGYSVAIEGALLEKHGIVVIIEPHLKGTQLDGAALRDAGGEPIIGITLRHDRLDNFWYTLLHEVAHLWRHVSGDEVKSTEYYSIATPLWCGGLMTSAYQGLFAVSLPLDRWDEL